VYLLKNSGGRVNKTVRILPAGTDAWAVQSNFGGWIERKTRRVGTYMLRDGTKVEITDLVSISGWRL
jgi:hypothetical protein